MIRFLTATAWLLTITSGLPAALQFDFDYRYDSHGFFDDPQRREALEAAGRILNRYVDELDPIVPEGDNTWTSFFTPPDGSASFFLTDLPVAADAMQIFVAGRGLSPGRLAQAVDTAPSGFGDPEWVDTVRYRGQAGASATPATDVGPMGGRISFNMDFEEVPWHFDLSTTDLEPHEFDFITVATHEIMHLMGFGVARSFLAEVNGGRFTGAEATRVGSSSNPELRLDAGGAHFIEGTVSPWNGRLQEALLAPGIFPGRRAFPTRLDRAVMRDIGWVEALPGDANRDGFFDSADLIEVFRAGLYETGVVAGWSDGDWNDNGLFESGDLIEGLQTGRYEQGVFPAANAVPEPSGLVLMLGALLWFCRRR